MSLTSPLIDQAITLIDRPCSRVWDEVASRAPTILGGTWSHEQANAERNDGDSEN